DSPIDRAHPYSPEALSCSVTEPPRSVCALIRLLRPPALDLLASGRTPDPGLATNVASVAGYSGAHNPVTGESPHPDVRVPPPSGTVPAYAPCRVTRPDGPPHRFFEVFTIGDRPGPVRSGEGPASHADYAFAEAPDHDILLIPGGFGTRAAVGDEAFLARLGAASRRAPVTTTVCTGSALL